MKYFGVTKWEQVLKVFEKGGNLEGQWGWLATLREAELGDTISFVYYPEHAVWGTELFSGTLATENGMLYLSSDVGLIPLAYAEKFPCDGYEVTPTTYRKRDYGIRAWRDRDHAFTTGFEATKRYPVFKRDPNRVDWISAGLDATSVVASLVGANPLTSSAKFANKAGQAASRTSFLKSLLVDQTPNSIILSGGGLIPGLVGGGFSLASLFYDLGNYITY